MKRNTYKSAGKRVKSLRITHGLTQEQLAEYLETSQKYISEIERGVKRTTVEFYIKIANFFGVSLSKIFEDSVNESSGINADTIMVKMKYLSSSQQEHMVKYMDLFIDYIKHENNN